MSTQTHSGITDRDLGFLGLVVLSLCFFGVMCAWDKGGDAVREELHDRSARTEHLLQAYAACRTPERDTFDDHAADRFAHWLDQQANRGRSFTPEQLTWLTLIRDRIVVDLEVRMEDFDDTPFVERGGLGKVWGLFGEELEVLVDELNRELVA